MVNFNSEKEIFMSGRNILSICFKSKKSSFKVNILFITGKVGMEIFFHVLIGQFL